MIGGGGQVRCFYSCSAIIYFQAGQTKVDSKCLINPLNAEKSTKFDLFYQLETVQTERELPGTLNQLVSKHLISKVH